MFSTWSVCTVTCTSSMRVMNGHMKCTLHARTRPLVSAETSQSKRRARVRALTRTRAFGACAPACTCARMRTRTSVHTQRASAHTHQRVPGFRRVVQQASAKVVDAHVAARRHTTARSDASAHARARAHAQAHPSVTWCTERRTMMPITTANITSTPPTRMVRIECATRAHVRAHRVCTPGFTPPRASHSRTRSRRTRPPAPAPRCSPSDSSLLS